MNKERRKQIDIVLATLGKVFDQLEDVRSLISEVIDGEQEAYDCLPQSFQDGERGQAMQEAIDNLQYALDEIEFFDFDSVYRYLDEAAQ